MIITEPADRHESKDKQYPIKESFLRCSFFFALNILTESVVLCCEILLECILISVFLTWYVKLCSRTLMVLSLVTEANVSFLFAKGEFLLLRMLLLLDDGDEGLTTVFEFPIFT